jgi:hypothetical protein
MFETTTEDICIIFNRKTGGIFSFTCCQGTSEYLQVLLYAKNANINPAMIYTHYFKYGVIFSLLEP